MFSDQIVDRLQQAGAPPQPSQVAAAWTSDIGVVILSVAADGSAQAEVVQALLQLDASGADCLKVPALGAVELHHQGLGVQVLHEEGVGLDDKLDGVVVLRRAGGDDGGGLGLVLEEVERQEGRRVLAQGVLVQRRAGQVELKDVLVGRQVGQLLLQVDRHAAAHHGAAHAALLPALRVGVAELRLQLPDALLQALHLAMPDAAGVRQAALLLAHCLFIVGPHFLHLRLQRQGLLLLTLQQLPNLVEFPLVLMPHLAQLLQLPVHVCASSAVRRKSGPARTAIRAVTRAAQTLRRCCFVDVLRAIVDGQARHHSLQIHLRLAGLSLQPLIICPQLLDLPGTRHVCHPPHARQLFAGFRLARLALRLGLAKLEQLLLEVAQLGQRLLRRVKDA
mmetsp:Transcript_34866/g.89200  ORF Transcript_34866/g.89200 Transcript_34866/m.89200 type:complete len:392 (-) Transcript_34866:575-1750(-)